MRRLLVKSGSVSDSAMTFMRERLGSGVMEVADFEALRGTAELAEAEMVVGSLPKELIGEAGCLKWLQMGSAGVNSWIPFVPESVILTTAVGVFDEVVADHVFALLLGLTRGMGEARDHQREGRWRGVGRKLELAGKTTGILGYGSIGRGVARRAKAFGMRVVGLRRRPEADGLADEVVGMEDLDRVLERSQVLVVILPGTEHTRGLLDERALGLLPEGALVVNVGRGSAIRTEALIGALESGRLGGAGLDVTDPEPLPDGHALWGAPNTLITAHYGGQTGAYPEKFGELVVYNLGCYLEGRVGAMRNRVDRVWGY
ncbi:D-2-hydroxyacid dehydrogenase [Mucisphaera sp.]|uniref:D-2-hydroxyacid dehydrogenase n=1 Tax=Mucisphaera sp. TaxID=2913024 RepID=UPI003D105760